VQFQRVEPGCCLGFVDPRGIADGGFSCRIAGFPNGRSRDVRPSGFHVTTRRERRPQGVRDR